MDEAGCCSGTTNRGSINMVGRFLRGGNSEVATCRGLPRIPSLGAQVLVNETVVKFVHPWLSAASVSNIRADVR